MTEIELTVLAAWLAGVFEPVFWYAAGFVISLYILLAFVHVFANRI